MSGGTVGECLHLLEFYHEHGPRKALKQLHVLEDRFPGASPLVFQTTGVCDLSSFPSLDELFMSTFGTYPIRFRSCPPPLTTLTLFCTSFVHLDVLLTEVATTLQDLSILFNVGGVRFGDFAHDFFQRIVAFGSPLYNAQTTPFT